MVVILSSSSKNQIKHFLISSQPELLLPALQISSECLEILFKELSHIIIDMNWEKIEAQLIQLKRSMPIKRQGPNKFHLKRKRVGLEEIARIPYHQFSIQEFKEKILRL